MISELKIKDIVKDNTARFAYYRAGIMYYTIKIDRHLTLIFPVPLDDIGDATLNKQEKAIHLMRYVRKAQNDGSLTRYHGN